jgi:hypothetical protein
MRLIADYAIALARRLMDKSIDVVIADQRDWNTLAAYGPMGTLYLNVGGLGKKWFEGGLAQKVDELLIHEFGHEYCEDHLASEYHEALCRLGAQMKRLACDCPEFFKTFTVD